MYTVTPEAVSKAISVCRQGLLDNKESAMAVSFALGVLEMLLSGTREVEKQNSAPAIQQQFPSVSSPLAQLPPNILEEWLEGPKEVK